MSDYSQTRITDFINLATQRLGDLTAEIADNYLEGGHWHDEYKEATVISRTLLALQNNYSTLSIQEKLSLVDDVKRLVNLNRYVPIDLDGSVFVYFNEMATLSGDGSGVSTFLELSDTIASYSGNNKKLLQVQGTSVGVFDVENKSLVTPVIKGNKSGANIYAVFKTDGTTSLTLLTGALTEQHIVVDDGAKVEISAYFEYAAITSTQKGPQVVSGDFGSSDPGEATASATFTHADLNGGVVDEDTEFVVNFTTPKSGLIVSGSNVQFATGNDTTSDSISVEFAHRIYAGVSTNLTLNASEIMALATSRFGDNTETIADVTADVGEYFFFAYDSSFPDINKITEDGVAIITGSFNKIGTATITNPAGIAKDVKLYRSNSTNAFSNNDLTFE